MKKNIINKFQNYRIKSAKFILTGLALLSSFSLFAQNTASKEADVLSVFFNPLFDVLLILIVLLLIIISVLGGVLVSVAESAKDKKKSNKNGGAVIGAIALVAFLSITKGSFAQAVTNTVTSNNNMGLSNDLFYVLVFLIGLELLIILVLINSIKLLVKTDKPEAEFIAVKKDEPSLLERLNASVPLEKEADILMDHNYDGIRELDNDLPPWWKYGFYLTIVLAVLYLGYYHIFATGDLQEGEYTKSIKIAHEMQELFQKNSANNVTESNAKMITDKHELMEAEKAFVENCFACHGKLGEGGVGPNLTDNYWIHGGSIKDIFKTIKYGWPDKGMKSWQADLSPLKINEIASYIKTLAGTNPPNGKAPQGDLYVEEGVMLSDSLKRDSMQVVLPKVDSIKVGKLKNGK